MAAAEQELGHVIIKVDDDFAPETSGERVWAKPLGDGLWEIQNTPWHTCEIAFGDIVLAKPDAPDHWPTFVKVVKPSGHRTLHIYFQSGVSTEKRDSVLKQMHQWKATHESANGRLYALDLAADGDLKGLIAFMDQMHDESILDYRTIVRGKSDA